MKTEKSNKTGKVIRTILMMIGAGAIIGYFSNKRNRSKSQEKALELGNYLLERVQVEKNILSNKAKELIKKTKSAGDNIDNIISDYGKKPV